MVNGANESFESLGNDLCIVNNWACQWKMSFDSDRSKQAQEVIFSRKVLIQLHRVLPFDNSLVIKTTHLELIVNEKMNFKNT